MTRTQARSVVCAIPGFLSPMFFVCDIIIHYALARIAKMRCDALPAPSCILHAYPGLGLAAVHVRAFFLRIRSLSKETSTQPAPSTFCLGPPVTPALNHWHGIAQCSCLHGRAVSVGCRVSQGALRSRNHPIAWSYHALQRAGQPRRWRCTLEPHA